MARLQSFLLAVVAAIYVSSVDALQVTPNSPCAAVCLDSSTLDKSDPNSSNTKGSDMTCEDNLFGTTAKGHKFQECVTCLQESHFSQGTETDQAWFLYNLRYSINYCVFGFPNNTKFDTGPCVTSEACGPLADSLREGILDPSPSSTYDYCDASGDPNAGLGPSYTKCLQCVHSGSEHSHLSNFLTALEAGCRQRPAPGVVIGLNATVFSDQAIAIVDPKAEEDTSDAGSGLKLSTPVIAAIAIGAAVAVLVVAGCVFMHVRKRRARARLGADGGIKRRRRASPLSFQCQTHLTPRDPNFQLGLEPVDEKPYMDPAAALGSNPVSPVSPMSASMSGSGLRMSPKAASSPWMSPSLPVVDEGRDPYNHGPVSKQPSISVTTSLPRPPVMHSSPQRASPDDYMSPQSATSTRSNAPLLRQHKPYVPSEYANSPSQQSLPSFSPVTQRGSPLIPQGEGRWDDHRLGMLPTTTTTITAGAARSLTRKHTNTGHWAGANANMEAKVFPTSFPPPPKR
jgi:hypothetical protein